MLPLYTWHFLAQMAPLRILEKKAPFIPGRPPGQAHSCVGNNLYIGHHGCDTRV